MLPEYFTNNVNFLTSVNIYGETIIDNSLDVYQSLTVRQSSINASTLYVSEKVGINTETPNVELTVNGSISSNNTIYDKNGNSEEWNSVYTIVNSKSGTEWGNSTHQTNFLPLSGGTVTGDTQFNKNVTIWGVLSATGGTYFANTIYSTTSALSVIHVGSGTALYVGSTGTGDIASFYDLDSNVEMLHIGGHDGDYPNVGIKTSTPNVDFTVKGEISSSEIIYDANGNSNQWNSVYTTVNSNSPEWDSVYTTVQEKSATEWNNTLFNQYTHSNFLPLSGGTINGKLTLVASTMSVAPLKIPHSSNDPSPITTILSAAGDIWLKEGIRYRDQTGTIRYVADINRPNVFTQNQIIWAQASTTNAGLRITQEGPGNALLVEDSSNPDSTPFVVDANGSVGIGLSSLSGVNAKLTIIGNVSSTGTLYASGGNSDLWNSVYTTVQSYSAKEWDNTLSNQYTHLNFLPLSGGNIDGNLSVLSSFNVGFGSTVLFVSGGVVGINTEIPNEALTVVGNISATGLIYGDGSNLTGIIAGDTVATTLVRTNSANWDSVYSSVNPVSSNWNSVYSSVNPVSSNWDSVYSSVNPVSSNWNSVYSTVQSYSAIEWDNTLSNQYTHLNFLPLSGGIVTGDLTVDNILQIGDGNPNFDFIITEEGNVGINTETPNEKLTVVGNISCTGLIYGDGSNLTGIIAGDTVATTLVRTNSANWDSVYTSVKDTSANWDSVYSSVNPVSSNWDSVYTSVKDTSANWDSVYSSVNPVSSNWDSVYTTVQSYSATEWDNTLSNQYTHLNFLPLSGGTITNNLYVSSFVKIGLNNTIASFYADDQKVGINTETPNVELTVVGNVSATKNYFSGINKSVFTPQTNIVGVSAISNIVAVSVLPVTPDISTLYIIV